MGKWKFEVTTMDSYGQGRTFTGDVSGPNEQGAADAVEAEFNSRNYGVIDVRLDRSGD